MPVKQSPLSPSLLSASMDSSTVGDLYRWNHTTLDCLFPAFPRSTVFLRFTGIVVSGLHAFILLCGSTIHPLMGIWVVSPFWLLCHSLAT